MLDMWVICLYIHLFHLSHLFQSLMFDPGMSASSGCMDSSARQTQGLLIFWFPMPEPAQRPPKTEPRVCRSVMRMKLKKMLSMTCRSMGLNWIMWSKACPVLRQPQSVNSRAEQSVTMGSETRPKPRSLVLLGTDHHSQGKHDERLRNVISQTGRQYTVSYPHTYTHVMVCFTSAAYDGLRWNTLMTVWKKQFQQNFWLLFQIPIC